MSRTRVANSELVNWGMPTGGSTGQILTKTSATDFIANWQTPAAGGGGGTTILNGSGAPTSAVGNVGDYYQDTTNHILYGPKGSGSGGYGPEQNAMGATTPNHSGSGAYSLGTRYTVLTAGQIVGLRLYASEGGTHVLTLWNNAGTVRLAQATAAAGSGWLEARFATPVQVTANQQVVAAYDTAGVYAETTGMPTSASTDLQIITGLYGTPGQFPTTTFSNNWFADLIYQAGSGAAWPVAVDSVPPGGTAGQVLAKASATDYATLWQTPSAGGGGLTYPLLAPDGTPAAPSYSWANDTAVGMFRQSAGVIGFSGALNVAGALSAASTLSVSGTSTLNGAVTANNPVTANQGVNIGTAGAIKAAGSNLGLYADPNTLRWMVTSAGHFQPASDNVYDIGASGANRPRDIFLGRNLVVGGTSQLVGNVGIGAAPSTSNALYIGGTVTGQSSVNSIYVQQTFGTSTTSANGMSIWNATGNSVALNSYNGLLLTAPGLGSGSTVATSIGINVPNMGQTGVTTAYGISISNQSGASGTNIGLYNAGTSQLVGTVSLGNNATPPTIHPIASATDRLAIEAPSNSVHVSGKLSNTISANAYWDGTNWQRYDVAQAAMNISVGTGQLSLQGAPAGANPISAWTSYLTLTPAGALTLPNGSITTPMIAANAVQAQVGSYFNTPTFSTTTLGWVTTPVSTGSVSCTGAVVRIEMGLNFSHSAANGQCYVAIGMDGTQISYQIINMPTANTLSHACLIHYASPSVGNHTFQAMVNNTVAGTLTLYSSAHSWIWVTEQRR